MNKDGLTYNEILGLWEEFVELASAHQEALAANGGMMLPMEPVSNLATLQYGQF